MVGAELGFVDIVLVAAEDDGGDAEAPGDGVEDADEAEETEVGGVAVHVGVVDYGAHWGGVGGGTRTRGVVEGVMPWVWILKSWDVHSGEDKLKMYT